MIDRRELLLLIAAAACGTPQKPKRNGRHTGSGSGSDDGGTIVDDWMADLRNGSQLKPSPIVVVSGDQIAYASQDELALVDATTLSRTGHFEDHYLSICLLPDGTLLGFAKRDSGPCEIDVIKASHIERTLGAPDCALMGGAHLLPASASEVYVSRAGELVRYRLSSTGLTELGSIALDDRARPGVNGEDQSVATGDGRVIVPSGKALQIYEVGKPTLTYQGATRSIAHLALGSRGRVWYSRWNGDGRIEHVMLARLADGLSPDASIVVAPARVLHIAAGQSGALAMLLFAHTDTTATWTLVYLDENGTERWRSIIDDDIVKAVGIELNAAFVAVTAKRVVLATGAHGLFAWDAAAGARIR